MAEMIECDNLEQKIYQICFHSVRKVFAIAIAKKTAEDLFEHVKAMGKTTSGVQQKRLISFKLPQNWPRRIKSKNCLS